jgi:hypothetical protein
MSPPRQMVSVLLLLTVLSGCGRRVAPAAAPPSPGRAARPVAPTMDRPLRVASADGYSLWRSGDRWVLHARDGARLELVGARPDPAVIEVALPGGFLVRLPSNEDGYRGTTQSEVQVFRAGRPAGAVPLRPILQRWLQDDAFWGGSGVAKRRRSDASRGLLAHFFTDARPVGGGVGALMRLAYLGGSSHDQPIVLEHVVQIDVAPVPVIRFLRRLRNGPAGVLLEPVPRVFEAGGQWLLHDPGEILALKPDGTPARAVAKVPTGLQAAGVAANRWLVFVTPQYDEPAQVHTLDVASGQGRPLLVPGPWSGAEFMQVAVATRGAGFRVRASIRDRDRQKQVDCFVGLPQCRITRLRGAMEPPDWYLWRGKLVLAGSDAVEILDARRGRRLAVLRYDRGE